VSSCVCIGSRELGALTERNHTLAVEIASMTWPQIPSQYSGPATLQLSYMCSVERSSPPCLSPSSQHKTLRIMLPTFHNLSGKTHTFQPKPPYFAPSTPTRSPFPQAHRSSVPVRYLHAASQSPLHELAHTARFQRLLWLLARDW
jgi:hypothetical protein